VIGLCVAVEGIAKLVPYTRSRVDDEVIATIQQVVTRWLDKRRFKEKIKNRAKGLLSQLQNVRVQDRLQSLINSGHLDDAAVTTWNTLRNKGVHSLKAKLEGNDDRDIQEELDHIHQVYVCMYQITFSLIGYEGTFSNYASTGFRIETYPIPISA